MSKFLAVAFVLTLLLLNSWAFMLYGFGVSVKSWWAFIGFGVVGQAIGHALLSYIEDER